MYHIRIIPVSWSCHRNHLLLVVTIPLNYCCNTLPRILKNTMSTSLYYSVHIIKYNNGQINKLNIVSVLIQMDDEVSRCNTESCMEWLLHTSNYLQYLYITIVSPQVAIFSNPCIVRLKSQRKSILQLTLKVYAFSPEQSITMTLTVLVELW